jgi:hypothetical protein
MNKGFTLFIAMVITGTLLVVSMGIVNLAVKGAILYSAARQSQHAFYAADTGIECTLFWDVKNSSGFSAFSTSTASTISCNNQSLVVQGSEQGSPTLPFTFNFSPDPYCAIVTVVKLNNNTTRIESRGYNTCDLSNPRRVERAVRVTY